MEDRQEKGERENTFFRSHRPALLLFSGFRSVLTRQTSTVEIMRVRFVQRQSVALVAIYKSNSIFASLGLTKRSARSIFTVEKKLSMTTSS